MGLDSVELLVEIETVFGITISIPKAERAATVGELHDAVWELIIHADSNKCITQSIFYRLRRQITVSYKIPPDLPIAPQTSLDALFPRNNRKQQWRKLEEEVGLSFPPLILSGSQNIFILLWLVITFGVGWFFLRSMGSIILIAFFALTIISSRFLAVLLPRNSIPLSTIGQLTQKVLELNYGKLNQQGISRKEMELMINSMIADKAGVDLNEVLPEKSFVNDLGIS